MCERQTDRQTETETEEYARGGQWTTSQSPVFPSTMGSKTEFRLPGLSNKCFSVLNHLTSIVYFHFVVFLSAFGIRVMLVLLGK